MIEQTLERIAQALETIVEQNCQILTRGIPAPSDTAPAADPATETPVKEDRPAPAAAPKGKGGKNAKAPEPAKEPEPEPEPEPESPAEDEGPAVEAADVRQAYLALSKALGADRAAEAKKTFDDYRAKVKIEKLEDMSNAQRAELKNIFEQETVAANM